MCPGCHRRPGSAKRGEAEVEEGYSWQGTTLRSAGVIGTCTTLGAMLGTGFGPLGALVGATAGLFVGTTAAIMGVHSDSLSSSPPLPSPPPPDAAATRAPVVPTEGGPASTDQLHAPPPEGPVAAATSTGRGGRLGGWD